MNDISVRLVGADDTEIFSNIDKIDMVLFEGVETATKLLEINGKKVRVGVIVSSSSRVYGISRSKEHVKSSRLFVSILKVFSESSLYLENARKKIEDKLNSDTNRLLHNLTTLNAHVLQDFHLLFPLDDLTKRNKDQLSYVENIIKKQPKEAAQTLLRIAKSNFSMKTEISVFNKLFIPFPQLNEKFHKVHKVILNVLYLFFSDFTDKYVYIDMKPSDAMAYFDYESIHVALYFIMENSVKYVLPSTTIHIDIWNNDHDVQIRFDMTSTEIKENEVSKIFEEGFSGSIPKEFGLSGKGIGMNRVSEILSLNGGRIEIKTHPDTLDKKNGIPYQRNEIIIFLTKLK